MYPCCLTKTEWTISYITGRTKFSLYNERVHGVPLRHSTCLKPPIGGFRNLASRVRNVVNSPLNCLQTAWQYFELLCLLLSSVCHLSDLVGSEGLSQWPSCLMYCTSTVCCSSPMLKSRVRIVVKIHLPTSFRLHGNTLMFTS